MRIMVINGSHREHGSHKVCGFVSHILEGKSIEVDYCNLAIEHLPSWSEDRRNSDATVQKILQPFCDRIATADGFVVVTPEWGGMVPSRLKNFFLLGGDFAHKPAMIVGVSSGTGGSYPIAELRMSSYKNTKLLYVPDHVIVRDVDAVLGDYMMDDESSDIRIKQRIDRSLDVLLEYADALRSMRSSSMVDFQKHRYGM